MAPESAAFSHSCAPPGPFIATRAPKRSRRAEEEWEDPIERPHGARHEVVVLGFLEMDLGAAVTAAAFFNPNFSIASSTKIAFSPCRSSNTTDAEGPRSRSGSRISGAGPHVEDARAAEIDCIDCQQ